MNYDVLGNILDIFLVRNWMSFRITCVFGLDACTGLYGIQILTDLQQGLLRCRHDSRIILEKTHARTVWYCTVRYGTVVHE
jgi:hypothetical protein